MAEPEADLTARPPTGPVSAADRARVAELLGRAPEGDFEVVVRDRAGDPVVIRNAPILRDGRPMPTLYWLVGAEARRRVGRLEASGGVRAAEAAVPAAALEAAHARYAAERDATVGVDHTGPRPTGGVGGTRRGVKCLHAHYAWHLAGGDDPVGRWTAAQLAAADDGTIAGLTAVGPTAAGLTADGPTAAGPTAAGPTAAGPPAAEPTAYGPVARTSSTTPDVAET